MLHMSLNQYCGHYSSYSYIKVSRPKIEKRVCAMLSGYSNKLQFQQIFHFNFLCITIIFDFGNATTSMFWYFFNAKFKPNRIIFYQWKFSVITNMIYWKTWPPFGPRRLYIPSPWKLRADFLLITEFTLFEDMKVLFYCLINPSQLKCLD